MRVLRVYHAGRDSSHRERDRALARAGVEVTVVVPSSWPGADDLHDEPFDVLELAVRRPGEVNRHTYRDPDALIALVDRLRPDVLDLHEEPFSAVVHQLLRRLPTSQPVVAYTAQNVDKRFPPPFARWERSALSRVDGLYPCSAQAASVAVGKGFRGALDVVPLPPSAAFTAGRQHPPVDAVTLLLAGRLVPEKGVLDAVRVLADLRRTIPATLELVGDGPAAIDAEALARELGVTDAVTIRPALDPAALARRYAHAQVLLVPSRATATWAEQFGRVVPEAHAAGAVVIAYASGALPEVVGDAGVLVAEGDVAAMAAAVLRLRRDPAEWSRLRALGLDRARECTWASVAAAQLDLYRAAIPAAGAPRRPSAPQRTDAVRRYGEPARLGGGARPFALPVLRADTVLSRSLARVLDAFGRRERAPEPAPVTVLFLDHIARLSGGELALLRLIEAMPDVRARVILGEDGPLRALLEGAGAATEVLALDPRSRDLRRAELTGGVGTVRAALHTAGYVIRLTRRLRALRPDVVHTNTLKAGFYGSLAARLAGIPVVWHVHDRIAEDYLPPRAVRLTRFALRHLPTFVVANSAETLRTAQLPTDRAAVIGNPVRQRADAFRPEPAGNPLMVGMVGRLTEWKGQHVLLRAIAALDDLVTLRLVTVRLVGAAMFGEDDYERRLHALVEELGLSGRVAFTGFARDVDAELHRFDILVHASVVPEPFGQVVLEGMAAGLPVVATAAGGPAEIITDGVDGLLVPPGEVAALAAALHRLSCDAELRGRLGAAAVARAADYAPERIAAQMALVYRRVLLGRRGAAVGRHRGTVATRGPNL